MASMSLPRPGKIVNGVELGPCVKPCQHVDCAATRRMAEMACVKCGEPIGYERHFFDDSLDADAIRLVHRTCAFE